VIARVHTLAAIVALIPLLVFAVIGISGALHAPELAPREVRSVPIDAPPDCARVVEVLGLSLAMPVIPQAIQHDSAGQLVCDFFHANGRHRITVLPDEHRLQVEEWRATTTRYLDILHMTTAAFGTDDSRMRAWTWINELALWCFLLLITTSVWMVFARRRPPVTTMRGSHHVLGIVMLPVAAIYFVSALQMAHRSWFGPIRWLNQVHVKSAPLAIVLSAGILTLAVTGAVLWWRTRRDRAVAAIASAVTLALIIWMRL
jgi:hypothetical protein